MLSLLLNSCDNKVKTNNPASVIHTYIHAWMAWVHAKVDVKRITTQTKFGESKSSMESSYSYRYHTIIVNKITVQNCIGKIILIQLAWMLQSTNSIIYELYS